jgi:hypothetical protein
MRYVKHQIRYPDSSILGGGGLKPATINEHPRLMQMRAAINVEGDAGEICARIVGEKEDAIDDIVHATNTTNER